MPTLPTPGASLEVPRYDNRVFRTPPGSAPPAPTVGRRIPSLDGLRAISIALVLLGHLSGTRGFPPSIGAIVESRFVDVANLGVRVFFVISGFLITGLLIREQERTGGVDLAHFYVRRTLRIFPAYFAFLGIVVAANAVGALALQHGDLLHALTYTMNYHAERSWQVGHLWSLSVEEQFYLLWPAIVLLLGVRRACIAAIAFIVAAPLFRVGEWYAVPGMRALIGDSFETVGDAIAVGCVLAVLRDGLWSRPRYRALLESRWAVPAALLVSIVLCISTKVQFLFGTTALNVSIALLVERCVRRPAGVSGRVLNTAPLVFVGTLSYSIYLWQQPFLNRTSSGAEASFPLNVLLAAICAVASFYLVEQPALRARPRIERWWNARRRAPLASGA